MRHRDFHLAWLTSVIILVLIGGTVSPAVAQSPVYSEVDRTEITTDDTVTFSLVIEGQVRGTPNFPVLDGFSILSSNQSTQITLVNGKMTTKTVFQYRLQPTREGTLTIPGFEVTLNGQTYTTEVITIEVSKGSGNPAQGNTPLPSDDYTGSDQPNVFVTASVNNDNPYIGQAVEYKFRFYRAINLYEQPSYERPTFSGFWNAGEAQQNTYDATIDDRLYRVIELNTVLFPTVAGQQSIEPGILTIPGSILQEGGTFSPDALPVNVKPLPQPAPADFHGAVGNYSIASQIDNQTPVVNEPITLKIIIGGDGNLNTLPDPTLPELNGWRIYQAGSNLESELVSGKLSGRKTIDVLMIPGQAGIFAMPEVSLTFFNPDTGKYATVQSAPISVEVSPSSESESRYDIPMDSLNEEDAIKDIRAIKPAPQHLSNKINQLVKSPLFWGLWLIPVAIVLLDQMWLKRKHELSTNPNEYRRSRAAHNAEKILKNGERKKQDPYATVGIALTGYLSDRFNCSISGMTYTELVDFLSSQGLPPSITKQVRNLLTISDGGRYAPGQPNLGDIALHNQTRQVIAQIEKITQSSKHI